MEPSVLTPIIHPNGDSKATVVARLAIAYRSLQAAAEAVRRCAPHGRNFEPEPGRHARYHAQHLARLHHLDAVMASVLAEVHQIDADSPGRP
jgi:hypothetical protein